MTHPTHSDDDFAPALDYAETVLLDDFVRVDRYTTATPRSYRSTVHQGYTLKTPKTARAQGALKLQPKTKVRAISTREVYTVQTRSGVTINAVSGDQLHPLLSVTDLNADELRRPGVLERLIATCLIRTPGSRSQDDKPTKESRKTTRGTKKPSTRKAKASGTATDTPDTPAAAVTPPPSPFQTPPTAAQTQPAPTLQASTPGDALDQTTPAPPAPAPTEPYVPDAEELEDLPF